MNESPQMLLRHSVIKHQEWPDMFSKVFIDFWSIKEASPEIIANHCHPKVEGNRKRVMTGVAAVSYLHSKVENSSSSL